MVVNIAALGYLIGSLMVDVDFDITKDHGLTRQYYCALMRSLQTTAGVSRLFVPLVLTGLSQIYLCCALEVNSLKRVQLFSSTVLVSVGLPSLMVSMFSVRHSCESSTAPDMSEAFAVVRAVHLVMFVLLCGALGSHSYILVDYVSQSKKVSK